MQWKIPSTLVAAVLAAFVTVACGGTPATGGASSSPKGTITIAGFAFAEGSVLAELYGQALAHDGYTVNYKLNLGQREIVAPALKSGQIDLYIGYAASDLEFYNSGAGEASGDVTVETAKLNGHLGSLNLEALKIGRAHV